LGSDPVNHVCESDNGRAFCSCGKVIDRAALRSIGVRPVPMGTKVTTDVHDWGTADTTEHWNDRVDVTMKPKTIKVKGPNAEPV
jgi:hypothetical protein